MHLLIKMACLLVLYSNGTASVVTSIFGGILQNEVNCLICGTESRKFDPFLGKQVEGRLVFSFLFSNSVM